MSKGKHGRTDRYFFDTEFNEQVSTPFGVDFISIAIVSQDGKREYYGINRDFNRAAARNNAWVQENVVEKLPPLRNWKPVDLIRQDVLDTIAPAQEVEFWAKNGSYDNFILCRLFGGMNGLRAALKKEKGVEKVHFRDSNELRRALDNPILPEPPEQEKHDALFDARQERQEYLALMALARVRGVKPQ